MITDNNNLRTSSSVSDGPASEIAESPAGDSAPSPDEVGHREHGLRFTLGRAFSWLARRWIVVAVCAVLIVLGAVAAYQYWGQVRPQQQAESLSGQAVEAASGAAVAILSYKHDSVDEDNASAQELLTGEFSEYYEDFTAKVVSPAAKEKAVDTSATVVGAAAESVSADHATVLLFINQSTVTRDNATPALTASSVRAELVNQDGTWLVSKFDPV